MNNKRSYDYYVNSSDSDSDSNIDEVSKKIKGNTPTKNCKNKLCNHKLNSKMVTPSQIEIKSIQDLIDLGKKYHCKNFKTHKNLDLKILHNLIDPLENFDKMIGMKNVKENIISQVLYFLQGFNNWDEMLHVVITGSPGVGKTELAKKIGAIYKELGILSTGEFYKVSRADLIAEYLGQTAIKTTKTVEKCRGGIMFIDEVYSLSNGDVSDHYAKECIDTLNELLSTTKDFLCIIAGYENDVENCFFALNSGLKRRFSFKYNLEGYTSEELLEIMKQKMDKDGWKFENQETTQKCGELFHKNMSKFKNFGGDIETFYLQCKIQHSSRLPDKIKSLSYQDIKNGYDVYIKHRKSQFDREPPYGLYI